LSKSAKIQRAQQMGERERWIGRGKSWMGERGEWR